MSTYPSPDAKAVVRAVEALTTQVKRIADTLTTPVVRYEVAEADAPPTPATTCSAQHHSLDDGRLCIRAAHHRGDHIDERGFHWTDEVAVYPTHDGPELLGMRVGIDPGAEPGSVTVVGHWIPTTEQQHRERQELAGMVEAFIDAQMRQAPAADEEQTLRLLRRESLLVLLTRLQRGRTLSETEADALRQHVETEIREANTARKEAQRLGLMVDEYSEGAVQLGEKLIAAREETATADRIRAEVQRDRDQHAAVLTEVLRHFTHEGHPGEPCLSSGWVAVKTVARWRSVVAPTVERPWWVDVAELRAELKEAQAAIERVRRLVTGAAQTTAAGLSDHHIGRYDLAVEVVAALDGTEQPTPEA